MAWASGSTSRGAIEMNMNRTKNKFLTHIQILKILKLTYEEQASDSNQREEVNSAAPKAHVPPGRLVDKLAKLLVFKKVVDQGVHTCSLHDL